MALDQVQIDRLAALKAETRELTVEEKEEVAKLEALETKVQEEAAEEKVEEKGV